MKTILPSLIALSLAATASAEFRTWTRNDGKTAELELVSVAESDGEKVGQFKMRNGRTVSLKASTLSEADAKLLADWKPAPDPAAAAGPASVFDEIIDGNLQRLDGKKLVKCSDATKPEKYYIFYYTASWCGPCQQFTPTLVEWYEKNKNKNFELVLITSDQDEKSMEQYAAAKKMPWPQLELRKVKSFEKKFDHKVTGIPSVITCDLQGQIVSRTESPSELTKLVKD